jgi:signal transduction histidine kinase
LPFADNGQELVSVTLRNLALCELALAGGYLMWHSRAALEREVTMREAEAERRLGEERLRIAREVHDVVAHAMVAINVQAGVAAHLLEHDTEQARAALLNIKRTSGDALTDLRATLGILRSPDQAAPIGPAAGLDDLEAVAGRLRAAGVEVVVDVDSVGVVPTPVHSASYRIVQEALTNVVKHSRAQRVSVLVTRTDDRIKAVIEDDGQGFDPGAGMGDGVGLIGMRERIELLDGTLAVESSEKSGTTVAVEVPT